MKSMFIISALLGIVLSTQAQNLKTFANSDGKYGFKTADGSELIKAKYDRAKNFSEGLAAVKFQGKWGFINEKDELIVPHQYDVAGFFYEGLAAVVSNGKGGFIDKTGKVVIPLIFDDPGEGFLKGEAEVILEGHKMKIDKNGQAVGKAATVVIPKSLHVSTASGLKWSFVDEGYVVSNSDVESIWDYISPLKDCEIFVKIADMNKTKTTINNNSLYTLASNRIKELQADGFSSTSVEPKNYLKNLKNENLVLGYLAKGKDYDILFFYTYKNNYIISIHLLNYNSPIPQNKKDLNAFLNSIQFQK